MPKPQKSKSGLSFTESHELQKLPEQVEELEEQLAKLDEALQDGSIYENGAEKAIEINNEREKLSLALDKLYARWEELELKANEE